MNNLILVHDPHLYSNKVIGTFFILQMHDQEYKTNLWCGLSVYDILFSRYLTPGYQMIPTSRRGNSPEQMGSVEDSLVSSRSRRSSYSSIKGQEPMTWDNAPFPNLLPRAVIWFWFALKFAVAYEACVSWSCVVSQLSIHLNMWLELLRVILMDCRFIYRHVSFIQTWFAFLAYVLCDSGHIRLSKL